VKVKVKVKVEVEVNVKGKGRLSEEKKYGGYIRDYSNFAHLQSLCRTL
ncbi:MAG: hypothetical protein ACI8RD_003704, partial [Bacillariaceae sp.]